MAVHGTNSLASHPIGRDQPSHGSGSKKDDEGFDSALGMAMFAIPPSIAMPSQTTDGGRNRPAGSVEASSVDGASAVTGDGLPSTARSGGRQAVIINDSVGSSSQSAAVIAASSADLALGSSASSLRAAAPSDGSNHPPIEGRASSIAQSGNDQVPAQGQAQAIAGEADGSISVASADAKSFENIAGQAFAGSADGTAAFAPPRSGPIADGTPAFAPPRSGPIADGTPAFAPPKSGPIADGTPALAPPKAAHVAPPSDPAPSKPSQDGVAGLAGSAAPTSPVRARALYADPATKPASSASQPKSATIRANVIAAEDHSGPPVLASRPSAKVAGQQSAISDNPSESATSAAIQEAAGGLDPFALAANDKRNLGPRTNSDVAVAHRSGGASADTPAMTGPAEAGGGAPQTAASAAVTLRTIAAPTPESRTANIRIDLASGQSTHATVREHSGAVDVRIVTSSQQSAQVIGSELPALRRALDGAGVQLKAADVSHQGDGQRGHDGQRQENQSPSRHSGDGSIFAIEEVKQ